MVVSTVSLRSLSRLRACTLTPRCKVKSKVLDAVEIHQESKSRLFLSMIFGRYCQLSITFILSRQRLCFIPIYFFPNFSSSSANLADIVLVYLD
jgi:hypothetical protein